MDSKNIREPTITVGIIDRQKEVRGRLDGTFYVDGVGLSGAFSAKAASGMVVFVDEQGLQTIRLSQIRLVSGKESTFTLFDVTIGSRFHWERAEDQTFHGSLVLMVRDDGAVAAINEISLEEYLKSVVSSEMSSAAPLEFLKAHTILSRSWVVNVLEHKGKVERTSEPHAAAKPARKKGEVTRWYQQEDHDLYSVCADDHCQRYQGITKILSPNAEAAVQETRGMVVTYGGEICDARYSKACGGLTEVFGTAWEERPVPYLTSIRDASLPYRPITTEEEAARWILSEPESYCNTNDQSVLEKILPAFDRETKSFFRWTMEYTREEMEGILREKSGFDFGTLKDIQPLKRGPSGRIFSLKIVGSKRSMVVGKELEIRRWLSKSHLYSSAFIVSVKRDLKGKAEVFTFCGAGWGHGVGLCQIGAAVMASKGFKAEEILRHYFTGVDIRTIY